MRIRKVMILKSLNRSSQTIALVALILTTRVANGQFPVPSNTQISPAGQRNSEIEIDKRTSANIQQKMAIARNDERQKRLISDTDKLVALVTQLKIDVDKTDKYMLSLEVVRRSEEIEKLAHSIKDRAKN